MLTDWIVPTVECRRITSVCSAMHKLGPVRQLALLVMLGRRSGKLAEF